VEAMWLMLQQQSADDYVLGTGECHSVQEFLEEAFGYVKLDWNKYVKIDPSYFRPTEVGYLLADSKKANKILGWNPKIKFKELVRIMVDADMQTIGLKSPGESKQILKKCNLIYNDRALLNTNNGGN